MQEAKHILKKYWGYDQFRPLQAEAIECPLRGRDSIVVLPTGGGKSLCYQIPAMRLDGLTVVVSPLISLMKDQVDALTENGLPAARIDSSQTPDQQRATFAQLYNNQLKLLYVSPERLVTESFMTMLREKIQLSSIAIDEAHCVSMWGHDFRPEYRQLGMLRQAFPDLPIGAYTATATEQVRRDIAQQLNLNKPAMLTGSFDRANLSYKVQPKKDIITQITTILDRFPNESGIIYCIRRKDVESIAMQLAKLDYKVSPYHAGLSDQRRKLSQELFIQDKTNIIVATIAFGMGIDKSNVRYVIHTGMPKSLENYQQESGRAGRDGLEAQCSLFYSGGDYGIWKFMTRDLPAQARKIALDKLNSMYAFCNSTECRHKAIVNYFGQEFEKDDCGACDICLGELEYMDDSLIVAQKIMSCVLRLEQMYGATYTAQVLLGSKEAKILNAGHDQLSTYGLLKEHSKSNILNWIGQLISQGCMVKTDEYQQLNVTAVGWQVLKGNKTPRLTKPVEKAKKVKLSQVVSDSWKGVERNLFEELRKLRSAIADERSVPAYVVFGDAALRDMARKRPSTHKNLLQVKGIGEKKCTQYGNLVLPIIERYCKENTVDMDVDIDRSN